MSRSKQIAIILSDTLQSIGLQSLLVDYFSPVAVSYFPTFKTLFDSNNDSFDYYITDAELFIVNSEFFLPRRNKTMVLLHNNKAGDTTNGGYYLNSYSSQDTVIEQLESFFSIENTTTITETPKDLSVREIDVLQLIVRGSTNKEVADRLNISLNTVLTHRKNITSKLGIKTVSGLTFYALMNGLIAGDEIEL